ncbi:hypothetical protein LOK49_LG12G00174 [Camellia lanceoleosa]|uniref:Uncharacterized protein n=1 Tax=Camellia lanceoleosa TaxID=1840588 RepID=A0ACC0FTH6_9ERIC|nr:hypothetical protein LOK49_LG12G00174 [Camellia lanceoleosa]
MDENINDFDDESNDELELYVVLQVVMKELFALCTVASVVIQVILKKYLSKYPRNLIRGPNRLQEQMDHINRLVRESDITHIEQLCMDRHSFMTLCNMIHTIGGLRPSKHVTLDEKIVSRYVNDVLKAMLHLQANILSTPNPIIEAKTDPRWNCFQNCLGALDGTYIRVRVSVIHQARYRTRKGDIATNVLGVCSQQMNFIYVLPGWEGSVADSRVLRDAINRPNGLRISNGNFMQYHVSIWKEGATPSNYQEYFNMKHAQARNVIERCFGLLKMRWAILRSASYYPIRTQNRIITAFDPIEDDDDDEENQPPMGNDFIDTVETSNEWTVWRDTLAMQLYNDCMLTTSGFGWNDTKKRIDVESDSVWEAYVRRDNDAKHLRNKTFPYFDEWIQIFGKDQAIEEFAEGPTDAIEAMNAEEDVLLHGLADNDTFLELMGVNSHTGEGMDCSNSATQRAYESFAKKKDKKRSRFDDDVVEELSMFADKLVDVMGKTNEKLEFIGQRMGYSPDVASKRASLNDELTKLPITVDERLDAC